MWAQSPSIRTIQNTSTSGRAKEITLEGTAAVSWSLATEETVFDLFHKERFFPATLGCQLFTDARLRKSLLIPEIPALCTRLAPTGAGFKVRRRPQVVE